MPELTAQIELYSLDSKLLFREEKSVTLSVTDVKEAISISSILAGAKGVNFVILNLKSSKGKPISHNVYWLSNDGDYKQMNDIQKTTVESKMLTSAKNGSEKSWIIQITNTTRKLAFFIRPQLMVDGEEVLPSYWSANYFTLAPSETITISLSCPVEKLKDNKPIVKISGWNVNEQELVLK
jgi:hypothetical protein